MRQFPLGRRPREHSPEVPHFSRVFAGVPLPAAPVDCDYTAALAGQPLGMMLNNTLGDCGEAAVGHWKQVLTANASGFMYTLPDAFVKQLYSEVTGYQDGNPATDNGTILQQLLFYLVNTGLLLPGGSRKKIAGFLEIDHTHTEALNLAMAECGVLYLGFNVPENLPEDPGTPWDETPDLGPIKGGHCVISAQYTGATSNRGIISWGSDDYLMTPAFWDKRVDEVYAPIDPDWMAATGKTPMGLTLADWQDVMQSLKGA